MKTIKSNNTRSGKSSNKKEAGLYLAHSQPEPQVQNASAKSQPGDMDMLERLAEKPLPPTFEQFDRSYKAMHSLFSWPLPIV